MYKTKCVVCETALKGHFLTLVNDSTPLSLSKEAIENFGITNLAFECGHEDCKTAVCYQCLDKMERRKEGKFLSKREHLLCPQCQEPFGEGGARFLLEGRFPANVSTVRVGVRVRGILSDRDKWVFQRAAKDSMVITSDLMLPTSVCSLCLSDAELRMIRVPGPDTSLSGKNSKLHKFSLCEGCCSILAHPAIEFPGIPYVIPLQPLTSFGTVSNIAIGAAFTNPDYMDLVRQMNSYLNWQKKA